MVYRISLKLVIILAAILLLLILGAYYFLNSGVFADDTFIAGNPSVQLDHSGDVDADGKDETINLLTYEVEDEKVFILEIINNVLSKRRLVLGEFEVDVRFCNEPVIDAKERGRYICVLGYVGVHSERVEIIKFENNRFNKIYFVRDGQKFDNMISDAPNVFVKDQNSSDVQICADSRNYDKDPLLDFSRTCYILNDNNEFEFNSTLEESMSTDEDIGSIQ